MSASLDLSCRSRSFVSRTIYRAFDPALKSHPSLCLRQKLQEASAIAELAAATEEYFLEIQRLKHLAVRQHNGLSSIADAAARTSRDPTGAFATRRPEDVPLDRKNAQRATDYNTREICDPTRDVAWNRRAATQNPTVFSPLSPNRDTARHVSNATTDTRRAVNEASYSRNPVQSQPRRVRAAAKRVVAEEILGAELHEECQMAVASRRRRPTSPMGRCSPPRAAQLAVRMAGEALSSRNTTPQCRRRFARMGLSRPYRRNMREQFFSGNIAAKGGFSSEHLETRQAANIATKSLNGVRARPVSAPSRRRSSSVEECSPQLENARNWLGRASARTLSSWKGGTRGRDEHTTNEATRRGSREKKTKVDRANRPSRISFKEEEKCHRREKHDEVWHKERGNAQLRANRNQQRYDAGGDRRSAPSPEVDGILRQLELSSPSQGNVVSRESRAAGVETEGVVAVRPQNTSNVHDARKDCDGARNAGEVGEAGGSAAPRVAEKLKSSKDGHPALLDHENGHQEPMMGGPGRALEVAYVAEPGDDSNQERQQLDECHDSEDTVVSRPGEHSERGHSDPSAQDSRQPVHPDNASGNVRNHQLSSSHQSSRASEMETACSRERRGSDGDFTLDTSSSLAAADGIVMLFGRTVRRPSGCGHNDFASAVSSQKGEPGANPVAGDDSGSRAVSYSGNNVEAQAQEYAHSSEMVSVNGKESTSSTMENDSYQGNHDARPNVSGGSHHIRDHDGSTVASNIDASGHGRRDDRAGTETEQGCNAIVGKQGESSTRMPSRELSQQQQQSLRVIDDEAQDESEGCVHREVDDNDHEELADGNSDAESKDSASFKAFKGQRLPATEKERPTHAEQKLFESDVSSYRLENPGREGGNGGLYRRSDDIACGGANRCSVTSRERTEDGDKYSLSGPVSVLSTEELLRSQVGNSDAVERATCVSSVLAAAHDQLAEVAPLGSIYGDLCAETEGGYGGGNDIEIEAGANEPRKEIEEEEEKNVELASEEIGDEYYDDFDGDDDDDE